ARHWSAPGMKLGLYGGAFNPIHRCHLLVAETARTRLGLDSVLFIPTGGPPHKPPSDFIPAKHRLEMVRLAMAAYPYFQLSDIETRREAKSYTIDTVRDRKSTRLNSSHEWISYAVFCLNKKS